MSASGWQQQHDAPSHLPPLLCQSLKSAAPPSSRIRRRTAQERRGNRLPRHSWAVAGQGRCSGRCLLHCRTQHVWDSSTPLQSCKTWQPPRCSGSGGRQYCTSAPQSQVQQVSAASPALGSQAHAGELWCAESRCCCGRRLGTVSTEVEGSASSGGALPGGAQSTAASRTFLKCARCRAGAAPSPLPAGGAEPEPSVAGLRSIRQQTARTRLGVAVAQAAPWRAGAGALCATDD